LDRYDSATSSAVAQTLETAGEWSIHILFILFPNGVSTQVFSENNPGSSAFWEIISRSIVLTRLVQQGNPSSRGIGIGVGIGL
jgi:hypothetical protein